MKNNTAIPFGFSSINCRFSTLISNAWILYFRYHASTRDHSSICEVGSMSEGEIEASRKITYELSSSIDYTLRDLLCFSECYPKHQGKGRPSVNMIMHDDQTLFNHGILLLSLDTQLAPQFAIKFSPNETEQLIKPIELVLGVNLNAYNRIYNYLSTGAYAETLSSEAQELLMNFVSQQLKNINNYLNSHCNSLGAEIKVIQKIGQHFKNNIAYSFLKIA